MSSPLSPPKPKPGKFRELEFHLREAIKKGTWAPGDRLPSFAELREQFDMAPSTVSRALLHLEQDGLVLRRPGSGIYVAEPPQRLIKGVIGFQGFSFKERYVPFWMNLMEGVQEAAHAAEFEVLLLNGQSEVKWEKVDGVLVFGETASAEAANLPPLMPRVAAIYSTLAVPTVTSDDFNGALAGVNHLLELGHTRIGYLCFAKSEVIQPRLAGYRAALSRAGITPVPGWVRDIELRGAMSARHLAQINMESWFTQGWHETGCTALLVQNDMLAEGVLDAFKAAGIEVPGEVSIVGYDGTALGENATPALTSIAVPLERIGAQAVEMLLRMIRGEHIDAVTLSLPTQIIARASSGPPPRAASVS